LADASGINPRVAHEFASRHVGLSCGEEKHLILLTMSYINFNCRWMKEFQTSQEKVNNEAMLQRAILRKKEVKPRSSKGKRSWVEKLIRRRK
jgi:hypothetical protein